MRRLINHPGEPYPSEQERTDHGTWTIPDVPLGRWTVRVGEYQSTDQLHSDVIAAAECFGYRPVAAVEQLRARLGDVPGARLGPVDALAMAEQASRAVAWLNTEVASPGRRFVLLDALYLVMSGATDRAESR